MAYKEVAKGQDYAPYWDFGCSKVEIAYKKVAKGTRLYAEVRLWLLEVRDSV